MKLYYSHLAVDHIYIVHIMDVKIYYENVKFIELILADGTVSN